MGEFFLTLEKDPQQEDFLQGRMQGNPYRFVLTHFCTFSRINPSINQKLIQVSDLIAWENKSHTNAGTQNTTCFKFTIIVNYYNNESRKIIICACEFLYKK